MKRAAVILAGGAGTRLRPLSSDENPKQFLRLFGGRSLIEMTYARVATLASQVYVSTNERYAPLVREHVPGAAIIAEPARRNTAPAIALSCFTIEREMGDCAIAVLPSDHHIGDEQEFARVLGRAYDFAATHDELTWRTSELFQWIGEGKLKVRIDREVPLRDAGEAHRALEARETSGKVLLIP